MTPWPGTPATRPEGLKVCPICRGMGTLPPDDPGYGATCGKCHGEGWLEDDGGYAGPGGPGR
jgi:hypothetical protein